MFANKRCGEQYFFLCFVNTKCPFISVTLLIHSHNHSINSSPWIVKLQTRSESLWKESVIYPTEGWEMWMGLSQCTGHPVAITKVIGHQSSSQWAILKHFMSLKWLEKNTAQIISARPENSCFWNVVPELWLEWVPVRILRPPRGHRHQSCFRAAGWLQHVPWHLTMSNICLAGDTPWFSQNED